MLDYPALEFAKKEKLFTDINEIRVKDLKNGKDINREFKNMKFKKFIYKFY